MNLPQRKHKGSTSALVLGIVVAIVALFIGLFMISKVSDITNISSTSAFYTTFTDLQTNTNTVYDVLILVIIVVALGFAIAYLRGFAGAASGGTGSV